MSLAEKEMTDAEVQAVWKYVEMGISSSSMEYHEYALTAVVLLSQKKPIFLKEAPKDLLNFLFAHSCIYDNCERMVAVNKLYEDAWQILPQEFLNQHVVSAIARTFLCTCVEYVFYSMIKFDLDEAIGRFDCETMTETVIKVNQLLITTIRQTDMGKEILIEKARDKIKVKKPRLAPKIAAIGRRIRLILWLLKSMSSCKENAVIIAGHPTFQRFMVVMLHCSYGDIREVALEVFVNVAGYIELQQAIDSMPTAVLYAMMHEFMLSRDRILLLRSIHILGLWMGVQTSEKQGKNWVYLSTKSEDYCFPPNFLQVWRNVVLPFYIPRFFQLLQIPDAELSIRVLESVFCMSSNGRFPCEKLCAVPDAVKHLILLLFAEDSDFGFVRRNPFSKMGIRNCVAKMRCPLNIDELKSEIPNPKAKNPSHNIKVDKIMKAVIADIKLHEAKHPRIPPGSPDSPNASQVSNEDFSSTDDDQDKDEILEAPIPTSKSNENEFISNCCKSRLRLHGEVEGSSETSDLKSNSDLAKYNLNRPMLKKLEKKFVQAYISTFYETEESSRSEFYEMFKGYKKARLALGVPMMLMCACEFLQNLNTVLGKELVQNERVFGGQQFLFLMGLRVKQKVKVQLEHPLGFTTEMSKSGPKQMSSWFGKFCLSESEVVKEKTIDVSVSLPEPKSSKLSKSSKSKNKKIDVVVSTSIPEPEPSNPKKKKSNVVISGSPPEPSKSKKKKIDVVDSSSPPEPEASKTKKNEINVVISGRLSEPSKSKKKKIDVVVSASTASIPEPEPSNPKKKKIDVVDLDSPPEPEPSKTKVISGSPPEPPKPKKKIDVVFSRGSPEPGPSNPNKKNIDVVGSASPPEPGPSNPNRKNTDVVVEHETPQWKWEDMMIPKASRTSTTKTRFYELLNGRFLNCLKEKEGVHVEITKRQRNKTAQRIGIFVACILHNIAKLSKKGRRALLPYITQLSYLASTELDGSQVGSLLYDTLNLLLEEIIL